MSRWEDEERQRKEEREAAIAEMERKKAFAAKIARDFWKNGMCSCKIFGDDSWPRTIRNIPRTNPMEYEYKHRKGCPKEKLKPAQGEQLIGPIATHIVELEEKVLRLHEKAAGAEGPFEPVAVAVSSRALALGRAHQDEYPDELSKGILIQIATGMGARLVDPYKWKGDYYQQQKGVPGNEPAVRELTEPDPASKSRKGEKTEQLVVVGESGNISYHAVFPNEQRARMFVAIAGMLFQLTRSAFNAGMNRGRSIVTQLAANEITWDQFAKMSEDFEKETKK